MWRHGVPIGERGPGESSRRQFIPIQRRLADADALAPFTRSVGSAVFAIPPGAGAGLAVAHDLLSEAKASRRMSDERTNTAPPR